VLNPAKKAVAMHNFHFIILDLWQRLRMDNHVGNIHRVQLHNLHRNTQG
jgi:hypothetical protein